MQNAMALWHFLYSALKINQSITKVPKCHGTFVAYRVGVWIVWADSNVMLMLCCKQEELSYFALCG